VCERERERERACICFDEERDEIIFFNFLFSLKTAHKTSFYKEYQIQSLQRRRREEKRREEKRREEKRR
jgi:hypothetical protein